MDAKKNTIIKKGATTIGVKVLDFSELFITIAHELKTLSK